METENLFDDAPIISRYTRSQAVSDGVLVRVWDKLSREAGFKYRVCFTREAWADCVDWRREDSERKKGCYQDPEGRLWDVLWMAKNAVHHSSEGGTELLFTVLRIPVNGRGVKPRPQRLKFVCGPDDDGSPCITIMMPHED